MPDSSFDPVAPEDSKPTSMNEMWADNTLGDYQTHLSHGRLFQDGNYGMFIHWGLYSHLGGKWKGKTYYGIGEWIMNENMAHIPIEEYRGIADEFDPSLFDATSIVQLAKDAGMKYVVLTTKHHEGFAMFQSADPFNIVDGSPFRRDPMKELEAACRDAGLGLGVYYSHFQDWVAAGGSGGPSQNPDGSPATFQKYFQEKCYPQVREICTQYGPLEVVWFDTPGDMPKNCVIALHDLVRETQPHALLASRIGYGLGDYATQGDMEVPPERIEGLWEGCDTTNDSWSYAWYDTNWKSPKQILERLIATVARGGTYLLNVGPDGQGQIPELCQRFLREAGVWLSHHPEVVYKADASPWRLAMPWGDVTRQGQDTLHLSIFTWPCDGRLYLPSLLVDIEEACLTGVSQNIPISHHRIGDWVCLSLPAFPVEDIISVVQIRLAHSVRVADGLAIHPNFPNTLLSHFADVCSAEKNSAQWMEKFGEWKHVTQVTQWTEHSHAQWTADVHIAGAYHIGLVYRGEKNLVWKIETDEGEIVQNQQPATSQFAAYPMGVIEFHTPGRHTLTVYLVSGAPSTGLAGVSLELIR